MSNEELHQKSAIEEVLEKGRPKKRNGKPVTTAITTK